MKYGKKERKREYSANNDVVERLQNNQWIVGSSPRVHHLTLSILTNLFEGQLSILNSYLAGDHVIS